MGGGVKERVRIRQELKPESTMMAHLDVFLGLEGR